jgi:hypothetical protein
MPNEPTIHIPKRTMTIRLSLLTIIGTLLCSSVLAQPETDLPSQLHVKNWDAKIVQKGILPSTTEWEDACMIPFRADGLLGFVRPQTKEWVIKPRFSQGTLVGSEFAIVREELLFGVINCNDRFIIQPQHHQIYLNNGLYIGQDHRSHNDPDPKDCHSHTYYKLDGRKLFAEFSHDFVSFVGQDTLAWFRYGPTIRIRTKTGRLAKEIIAVSPKKFIGINNNLLVFTTAEYPRKTFHGFDLDDNLVFTISNDVGNVEGIYRISANLFIIQHSESSYLFTDSTGNELPFEWDPDLETSFTYPGDFIQSTEFVVRETSTGLIGVINRDAEYIVEPRYQELREFTNGLSIFFREEVRSGSPWGLLNLKGDTVVHSIERGYQTIEKDDRLGTPFSLYDSCYVVEAPFRHLDTASDGTISSFSDDLTFFKYVNAEGDVVLTLPPNYKIAGNFGNGLAVVIDFDSKMGFINKQGEVVIPLIYEARTELNLPMSVLFPRFKNGYVFIPSQMGYIDTAGNEYFSGAVPK